MKPGVHEVPREPRADRTVGSMEPWEASLPGSSSFGGMARSGEHRRFASEMGIEWIDVFGFAGKRK